MEMLRAVLLAECALVLVLLLPAFPPAQGAVFQEIVTDPDHPGTCLFRKTKEDKGTRMKEGQRWFLPYCMSASCYHNGEDMVIAYYTCGRIGVPPGCRLTQDMSKPYPGCCGDVDCNPLRKPSYVRAERRAWYP